MIPETLPPYRHISSTPTSLPAASTLLTNFLSNSEIHPQLHPDALITPVGVAFSSHGGPLGGVVMHNLRRVAAGLRGEYLEPEATPEPEEGKEWQKNPDRNGVSREQPAQQEDWQNIEDYEREVEIEVGEVGDRNNFVGTGNGGEAPEVQDTEEGGKKRKNAEEGAGESNLDKEAMKKARTRSCKKRRRGLRELEETQLHNQSQSTTVSHV